MNLRVTDFLLRWLPADSRAGVVRRGVIVWIVAFFIAIAIAWFMAPSGDQGPPWGASLVYSYAISTCIWFLTDPLRIAWSRWLKTESPHYWAFSWRMVLYLVLSTLLGYLLGTQLGDVYTGQSLWTMRRHSPQGFWLFLLGSAAVSAAFLFYFYQREHALALKSQATEARLRLLETQLEPHMLFNTLANLRVLIQTDPPGAVAMLDRLNGYLRATLAASRTVAATGHPLSTEFQRLRDYLELMAVRMGPRLRYVLTLPDELAPLCVPPLLLQPLVENAIRHGLEPSVPGGEVRVSARQTRVELVITVSDTGVGCSGEPAAGFGLAQVRERLATAFGARARLRWDSTPGQGACITLTLPLPTTHAA
jgi:hypothetical protein